MPKLRIRVHFSISTVIRRSPRESILGVRAAWGGGDTRNRADRSFSCVMKTGLADESLELTVSGQGPRRARRVNVARAGVEGRQSPAVQHNR
jgi:hypothetical protein